jgi:hypothetical protein
LGQAELWANDMDDALPRRIHAIEAYIELMTVDAKLIKLCCSLFVEQL